MEYTNTSRGVYNSSYIFWYVVSTDITIHSFDLGFKLYVRLKLSFIYLFLLISLTVINIHNSETFYRRWKYPIKETDGSWQKGWSHCLSSGTEIPHIESGLTRLIKWYKTTDVNNEVFTRVRGSVSIVSGRDKKILSFQNRLFFLEKKGKTSIPIYIRT